MHEMAIVCEIVDEVRGIAKDKKLVRVRVVEIDVGELKAVVPGIMKDSFEVLTAGTVAEGSELAINVIPAQARCRICGLAFRPTLQDFLCPDCGKADVLITGGNEIIIRSISGDQT